MKKWDRYEQEHIFDLGGYFDENEVAHFSKERWETMQYTGTSINDENVRTLMIPSIHGCCLIFENKHFVID